MVDRPQIPLFHKTNTNGEKNQIYSITMVDDYNIRQLSLDTLSKLMTNKGISELNYVICQMDLRDIYRIFNSTCMYTGYTFFLGTSGNTFKKAICYVAKQLLTDKYKRIKIISYINFDHRGI